MAKKLSAIQKAYNKERRRIQRQISRMEQRGYLLPENILPKQPKRITQASVRRLKNLSTKNLYQKAEYVNVDTGEIVSGRYGRTLERQASARKGAEKRLTRKSKNVSRETYNEVEVNPNDVLYDYANQIFTVFQIEMTQIYGRNDKLFRYISRWFNRSRLQYGDEDFADALEKSKEAGMWPGWEGVSDTEILVGELNGILEMVGGTQGGREEIMESLENGEEWINV
jgi:hypothetical protein|nr:MAG TPA: hypothetical protein [Caudoviricetes sp.]